MAISIYSYTETSIVDALRNTVGDPASAPSQRWDDATLVGYLNRGGNQMVLDVPELLQTVWSTDTVDGTEAYQMPINFVAEKQVRYIVTAQTDEHELEYLTWDHYRALRLEDDAASTGVPVYYSFWRKLGDDNATVEEKTSIYLSPTPSASLTNGLKVRGYKVPQDISTTPGTDVLEIEAHFCEAMIFWAAHLLSRDDHDDVRSERFKSDYREQIQKVKAFKSVESRNRVAMLDPFIPGGYSSMLPQHRRVR